MSQGVVQLNSGFGDWLDRADWTPYLADSHEDGRRPTGDPTGHWVSRINRSRENTSSAPRRTDGGSPLDSRLHEGSLELPSSKIYRMGK